MHGFDLWTAFLVFTAYLLIDGAYALFTRAVARSWPVRAATIGAAMHFLLAYGVVSYNKNWLYVFPLAAGSWLGTWYVVKRASRKDASATVDPEQLVAALEKRGIEIRLEELVSQ